MEDKEDDNLEGTVACNVEEPEVPEEKATGKKMRHFWRKYFKKFAGQNQQPPGGHTWEFASWSFIGTFIAVLFVAGVCLVCLILTGILCVCGDVCLVCLILTCSLSVLAAMLSSDA